MRLLVIHELSGALLIPFNEHWYRTPNNSVMWSRTLDTVRDLRERLVDRVPVGE